MPQVPVIAKVIIDIPVREVDKVFDYLVPERFEDKISVGSVVVVPFGRIKRIGFVVGLSDSSDIERLLPLEAMVNEQPVFDNNMVLLCKWIADYYLSTFVEALKLAIPPGFTSRIIQIAKITDPLADHPKSSERNVYNTIAELGGLAPIDAIKAVWPYKNLSTQLNKLESAGLIERTYELERSKVKELTANYAVLPSEFSDVDRFEAALVSLKKAPKQRYVFEALYDCGSQRVARLLSETSAPHSSLLALVERGFVNIEERQVERLPVDHFSQNDVDVDLTDEQQEALSAILNSIERVASDVYLLQGVTGSGKTEVYLRAIQRTLELGKGAIVLVPEIVLTAQAVARFKARFGESVAVLHSGLGAGERLDQWRGIREGRYRVVVGARSAIFAPVENLGIIVVDEEHESSYKQGRSPRYNAREVAIKRGELNDACVVLGSATPSLEAKWCSENGVYRPLFLRRRVQERELPRIEIVDMRDEKYRVEPLRSNSSKDVCNDIEVSQNKQDKSEPPNNKSTENEDREGNLAGQSIERRSEPIGKNETIPINAPGRKTAKQQNRAVIGSLLKSRIDETLDAGEKVILFLNRRGFSNFIICDDCGFVPKCDNCAVSLTYHSINKSLRCHHCNYAARAPEACPKCGGLNINFPGLGTQRVEIELREYYPDFPIIRMDADTTARKGAHQKWLAKFQSEKSAILLGTQMIAKGLDFPEVTLVGVINADTALNLPDFHAAEHTFQLMMQVAGRAGRGEQPGRVIIQTRNPESVPLQAVLVGDYDEFYRSEIENRKELSYPPFSSIIRLVFSGKEPTSVVGVAKRAAKIVESAGFTGSLATGEIATMVGPSPAPLIKVKSEYRWHLLLKVVDKLTTKSFLMDNYRRFIPEEYQNVVSLMIDVDPVWVL